MPRDDNDRGRDRDRDRDDSRNSRSSSRDDNDRGRDRDRDDRGGRGGRSGFVYEQRDTSELAKRSQGNSRFDKYVNGDIKIFKPKEGLNVVRILPPTWKGAKHYGYDIYVHFSVGADQQTYLCLNKMAADADAYFERMKLEGRGGDDPIEEEALQLKRDGYEEEGKKASRKHRIGVYLIDRDNERDGVQFWPMAEGNDTEIVQHCWDARKGTSLVIDDPENGFDISFHRKGTGINTKYSGFNVDRDSSALGNDRWLQWAIDHPIPEQLLFYSYEHIKAQLGGGGAHVGRGDKEDDRGARQSRDRDDSSDRGRGRSDARDDNRSSRDSNDDRGGRSEGRGVEREDSGRDSRGGRGSSDRGVDESRVRGRSAEEPTWESIHDMTRRELEDLVDDKRLDVKPKEARDDGDLADWVCEEMRIKKTEPVRRSMADDSDDSRRDKMAEMRSRRDSR